MTVAAPQEFIIKAPEFRGGNLALGSCRDLEVCLDGAAGCIAGETRLYNPVTGEHVPVKELYDKKIAPIVQTLVGAIQADVPFRKGVADLYRLTLASGRKCIVTLNHLVLSDNSWIYLDACVPGTRLLISSPCPHPTTEVSGPLVSRQDALHLSQTVPGSQDYCSVYSRQRDVPLQLDRADALTFVPSLNGALGHTRVDLYKDDWQLLQEYIHHSLQYDHHAKQGYSPLPDEMAYTQSLAQSETSLLIDALCQYDERFQKKTYPLSPIAQSLLDGDNMRLRELWLGEYLPVAMQQKHDDEATQLPGLLAPCSWSSDKSPELSDALAALDAYNPSRDTSNDLIPSANMYYTGRWDTVSSIEYVRTDEYFDLHVPVAEHYLAEGIWHHNTGKTYAALYKIHLLLTLYPGARALVARKTNTALSGSAMVTFREDVLRPEENVKYFGGNRIRPAAFLYPNGSELVINGLDKAEKVKSTAFDIALVNEATEVMVDDWEFVRSRLRHGKLPYHQLIADVNPVEPGHWLNQRMNAGLTTRLLSRHEDNPRYFSALTQDWTEEGYKYIFEILGGLTGVRLARLRYGIWAAAEGTIYEQSFDKARNVIDRFPIPLDWPRYLCIDFGFVNPFVCGWWARDPDGRLICYREIYMTKRLVEDHVKDIKRYSRWGEEGGDPLPREIIADHDAEGRATFERHTGLYTTPAHKAVAEGIEAVASQLLPAGDGKPRLMYFRDALVERDKELAARKKPACTVEEYDTYIWKAGPGIDNTKDEPRKEDDHGMDMSRYMCSRFYLRPTDIKYSARIY